MMFCWRVASHSQRRAGPLGIVRCPSEVGSCVQEAFGGASLGGCAGMPERLRDLVLVGAGRQERLDPIQPAQGCGVP
jgi:hypothetical protein